MKHARRLACAVGSVGVGVLSLSVAHCTESIGLLTGSHGALSGLLAVGIDAGTVASELAELASHGTKFASLPARGLCPARRGCSLCHDDQRLRSAGLVIAFQAHDARGAAVRQTLLSLPTV
jgi:hypothetical protein